MRACQTFLILIVSGIVFPFSNAFSAPVLPKQKLTELSATELSTFSTTETFREAHGTFLHLATGEGKDIEVRFLNEPDHDLKNDGGANVALNEFLLTAELPIILSRDFFLRVAPKFSARVYDLHAVTLLNEELQSETLYKNQLGLGAGYFVNDSLFLTGMVTPGILSSLDARLTSEDMSLYGEAFAIYSIAENFQVIGGVVTDELFEKINVYPVLAARYLSTDEKWHIKLTPPVAVRVGYNVEKDFQLYTGFFLTGDKYHIHLNQVGQDFNIQVQDKRLGFGALYFFTHNWNVSAEIGASLTNVFKFKVDGSEVPGDNTDTCAYAFISLGYAL